MAIYPVKLLKDESGSPFVPLTSMSAVIGEELVQTTFTATEVSTGHFMITSDKLTETELQNKVIAVVFPDEVTATTNSYLKLNSNGTEYQIFEANGTSPLLVKDYVGAICFIMLKGNKWQLIRTSASGSSGGGGHTILDGDGNVMPQQSILQFKGFGVSDSAGTGATVISTPSLINNLTTTESGTGPLDAYQGKILNDKILDHTQSSSTILHSSKLSGSCFWDRRVINSKGNVSGYRYMKLFTLSMPASWIRSIIKFSVGDGENNNLHAEYTLSTCSGSSATLSFLTLVQDIQHQNNANTKVYGVVTTNNSTNGVVIEVWVGVSDTYFIPTFYFDNVWVSYAQATVKVNDTYTWTESLPTNLGVYEASGNKIIRGTINGYTLKNACSKTTRTASSIAHSGWANWDTDSQYVPDMAFIAYWNGAHSSSGSSNLQYCDRGRFGTIVTKSSGDYISTAGGTLSSGSIKKAGGSHSWNVIRDSNEAAPISITSYTGYQPAIKQKTPSGTYGIGCYSNAVHITYFADGTTHNDPLQLLQINYNGNNIHAGGVALPHVWVQSSQPSGKQAGDIWFVT